MARYYKAVRPDGTDFHRPSRLRRRAATGEPIRTTPWRRLPSPTSRTGEFGFIAIVILVRGGLVSRIVAGTRVYGGISGEHNHS